MTSKDTSQLRKCNENIEKERNETNKSIMELEQTLAISWGITTALGRRYLALLESNAESDAAKKEYDAAKKEYDATKKQYDAVQQKLQELEEKIEFINSVAKQHTFTHRFDFGMVGRSSTLDKVIGYLLDAKTSAHKEDNCPTAVLSSPRQGKSLFLDELARRVLELDPNAVVIKVNMNGSQAMVANSADDALGIVCRRMLGCSLATRMRDVEAVRSYLKTVFGRDTFIVILIDELTPVLEKLTDDELKMFGQYIIHLCGDKCAVVFTGYDHFLASTFSSASGRVCRSVFLPPVFPDPVQREYLRFLPLKVLLLLMYCADPTQMSTFPLLYEFSKVTPGVLGALATRPVGSIPILREINKKRHIQALLVEYAQYCVANCDYPIAGSPLGESLLKNKIGVILQDKKHTILADCEVFIPPIFAFAAILGAEWDPATILPQPLSIDNINEKSNTSNDDNNQNPYSVEYDYKDDDLDNVEVDVNTAFGVTAAVVYQWVQQLQTPNHELSDVQGEHFEYYVYSCLLFRLLLCSPPPEPMLFPVKRTWKRFIMHKELFSADEHLFLQNRDRLWKQWNKPTQPLRLSTKYPTGAELKNADAEKLTKRGICMTCDKTPCVDMIIRVSATEEIWVECKSGTVFELKYKPYIPAALERARKANIKKVTYIVVTPATEAQTRVSPLSTDDFTARTVTIGTRAAEWFLTPLLASVGPNLLAADQKSWEQRFQNPRMRKQGRAVEEGNRAVEEEYIGIKSKEELRGLGLTDDAMAVADHIRKNCEAARMSVAEMLTVYRANTI